MMLHCVSDDAEYQTSLCV